MTKLFIALSIALGFVVSPVQAQAPVAALPLTAASSAKPSSPPSEETLVLRTQVAELQRFQEQVLSTVYWSLGVLGGIAALLVGFGWWTNFRVYERDKAALERELRSLLSDSSAQSREEQRIASHEHFATLKQQTEVSASSTEARLSTALAALVEAAEKRLAAQVAQVKATTATLGKQVLELDLAAHLQERLAERDRKSFRNALQTSVTALEMANEIGDDYAVGNVLDLVAEDIRTILGGSDLPIDNFLVGQLIEVLNAVKGSHAHAAAAMKAKATSLASA